MGKSSELRTGSIILAPVRAPEGTPLDPHPALVLNEQKEIDAGLDLRVAVCTTSCNRPWPSGWFQMPATPVIGHPITGLTQACVVKATWIDIVPQAVVIKVYGRSTRQVFKQVVNWIADKSSRS